jgi:hypothetical protein
MKRRSRNRIAEALDPRVWAWLAQGVDDRSFAVLVAHDRIGDLWAEHGTASTAAFAKANPGKRSEAWWIAAAPEPRRRLGGAGVPCFTALNYIEHRSLGVPCSWVQPDDWRYYNGQLRDIAGELIDNGYKLGDFRFAPVNPNDPPAYESQAAYLRRLGLLLPGELKRLTDRDFEPELLVDAIEPDDDTFSTEASDDE